MSAAFARNSGKVIALSEFRKVMRFQPLQEVRAYWEGLRCGRPVPLRSEIDPRGIEGALDHAFMLDRVAPGVARFRLGGQELTNVVGEDTRGMPLDTLVHPEARAALADAVTRLFDTPAIIEITLSAECGIGKPPVEAQMLLLPVKSDGGRVDRAIGCLVTEGIIGRAPRRFIVTDIRIIEIGEQPRIKAVGPVQARLDAPMLDRPATAARAIDGSIGADAMPAQPKGKPALRLVRSDD